MAYIEKTKKKVWASHAQLKFSLRSRHSETFSVCIKGNLFTTHYEFSGLISKVVKSHVIVTFPVWLV